MRGVLHLVNFIRVSSDFVRIQLELILKRIIIFFLIPSPRRDEGCIS